MNYTDRMKVLQMAAIPVARSLRAVFCWLHLERAAPPTDPHKIVLNVDVAEEWVLDEKNLTIGRPTVGTDDSSEGCRRTPIRVVIG
jgi:hypothetical protein